APPDDDAGSSSAEPRDMTSLNARLIEIQRRALANLEERGLETLFLAAGMATWSADDGGRPAEAAVVLIPLKVESRGREGRSLNLQRAGETQINLVLLHLLEAQFGVHVAPESLLANAEGDDASLDPSVVYG